MEISAYFAQINAVLDRFATAEFVLNTQVSFETRPDKQGYLHGAVTFTDNSHLHFKEYIDAAEGIEKLSYSYHYQAPDNALIFRYDNAAHKPRLAYQDHKHLTAGTIVQAKLPSLMEVLTEIVLSRGWQ